MLYMNTCISLLLLMLLFRTQAGIVPIKEVMLYPNTENSPSLYFISFRTSTALQSNEYILVTMDWLSSNIRPFNCLLVNSSINIRCTNLITPTAFSLPFTNITLQNINPQISLTKTIAIQVLNALPANTDYFLEISLLNIVENLKKISPSMEVYTIDRKGLVHQMNLNFGPVAYKPPITNILGVNVYSDIDDLANGEPGKLVTLKAQIRITIPIITPFSSLFFILQHPFEFSSSSYVTLDEAEQYATSPIAINSRPSLAFYQVVSPHIFSIVFNEKFLANRKFIVMITEIKNPFYIASSNVSVYSANFNSLTPLQAYESVFPIKTVTQTLSVTVGLPYDIPMVGPCVFYRNRDNYYKVQFNMPKDVPAGYAIKVLAFQNTIQEGTAYVNFQSLNYTTIYEYFGSNYFTMRGMGPIMQGSLIQIIFKGYKSSLTNFYISVYIDTEAVIAAGTAANYMFYGRADLQSVDSDEFFYYMFSGPQYEPGRVDTAMVNDYVRFYFCMRVPTSTGSYVQMYLSPEVTFDPNFDPNINCRFFDTANTAICRVQRTANYVYIEVKPSATYSVSTPNAFPETPSGNGCNYIWVNIYKIRFPRPSSNKYPFMTYFRLFNSSAANPTTYIESQNTNVLPRSNQLVGVALSQHGNINTSTVLNYPSFIRFESKNTSDWSYVLQENQVKIISIYSSYGFRQIYTFNNDDQYPCTSNIGVTCYFKKGIRALGDWWKMQKFVELERIDIFFKNPGDQTANLFHIIIPDGINVASGGNYYFFYQIGVYNKLTKDYKYLHRNSGIYRNPGWAGAGGNNDGYTNISLQGKAGSYRDNVTINVASSSISTNYLSFITISSSWLLFENSKTSYTTSTISSANPQFYSGYQSPLSLKTIGNMYLTIIPFKITSGLSTFSLKLNSVHLPYHYDLPNYYIFTISNGNNDMITSNQFQMTNQGIFYETYLQSLNIQCQQNYLGVINTICTIVFGTQSPLKADGKIIIVFSGMNVATDVCEVLVSNSPIQESCYSTSDNKNVTISMVDTNSLYHYPAGNFTVKVWGVSIIKQQISQAATVYLTDSSGKYIIQHGTRILTTTVTQPSSIQINEITYKYLSPLSANKISIRFSLPRVIYSDQRFGFIMGKDLCDVNTQLQRLRIVLTNSVGVQLEFTTQFLYDQFKVLFNFKDYTLLTPGSYLLQIFGIMTPVSHNNGAFSIIYQRIFDKAYTQTNSIKTAFPQFQNRISSQISMQTFFNTQGLEQKLQLSLVNTKKLINSDMVWIINFPSYYSEKLFNYNPYCMIDLTPIQCYADTTTPFQLIIKNSPKIIQIGITYKISVFRIACPRAKYMNDYYRNYYIFVGALEKQTSSAYCQSALLYPEQAIQSMVNGIISITNVVINTLSHPTFSSIYAIFTLVCNIAISSGNVMYIIFPYEFDNFNNNPISLIMKISNTPVLVTDAAITDRTLQLPLTLSSSISINTQIIIQFPSLPTPKQPCQVQMSQTIVMITSSNKKSVVAASSMASNSAPLLTFTTDPRYLSFNHDNTIDITAGTYSQPIDILPSDSGVFATNIVVNLTSTGFVFEPESILLRQGDKKGVFRVGADSSIFPIYYFYSSTKSEQTFTYYTITKNNNIRVTNNPVQITLPSTIQVPINGCSIPFELNINNPPFVDLTISFNYDNAQFNQSIFWPNLHTTKSTLDFDYSTNTKMMVSFCTSSGIGVSSFPLTFVLSGTNYRSYSFTPSSNVTISIIATPPLAPTPSLVISVLNRQKTFLQFNVNPSSAGTVFYHFQLGYEVAALNLTQIQVHLKNKQYVIQSMKDFMNYLYVSERDKRVGYQVRNAAGIFVVRFDDLLPQRYYTFCAYLQISDGRVSTVNCVSVQTQSWGVIMRAKISFTSTLNSQNLNKVLCYFAKQPNTEVQYALSLESNSCSNRQVENLYYRYSGQSFNSQSKSTNIYIITNPYVSSDAAPTAFQNMYNGIGQLSSSSLSSALSGFAISFLSSTFTGSFDAISMIDISQAQQVSASFQQPIFTLSTHTITVPSIVLSKFGTVYFALVLYKQVVIDGNNSEVKIRLNVDPTGQQILNCLNWQNLPAEGCARAVYSYTAQTVVFANILQNCMYKLYYVTASQYPLRPIISNQIQSLAVVTFVWEIHIISAFYILALLAVGFLM